VVERLSIHPDLVAGEGDLITAASQAPLTAQMN